MYALFKKIAALRLLRLKHLPIHVILLHFLNEHDDIYSMGMLKQDTDLYDIIIMAVNNLNAITTILCSMFTPMLMRWGFGL